MIYWAYQANEFKPLHDVKIAIHDIGFMMGVTVTDQCRTYRQQLFRLEDHLERFARSCELCSVRIPPRDNSLRNCIHEVLNRNLRESNDVAEWSVVWLLTPGKLESFYGKHGGILDATPELIVYALPLDENRYQHYYKTGAEVLIARSVQSNQMISPFAKQRSRLHWWLAENEVKSQSKLAHPLLLDHDGYITETTTCNLVLIRGGKVISPTRHRILQGISLKMLEEICRKLGIPFIEADLREEDLAAAEEALLASTPFGIAPIGQLAGKVLPVQGPVFQRLWNGWNELTASTTC